MTWLHKDFPSVSCLLQFQRLVSYEEVVVPYFPQPLCLQTELTAWHLCSRVCCRPEACKRGSNRGMLSSSVFRVQQLKTSSFFARRSIESCPPMAFRHEWNLVLAALHDDACCCKRVSLYCSMIHAWHPCFLQGTVSSGEKLLKVWSFDWFNTVCQWAACRSCSFWNLQNLIKVESHVLESMTHEAGNNGCGSAWPCQMLCQHGTVRLLWMCSISLDLLTSKCCPTSLRRQRGGPRESWLTSDQKTENDSTIICIGGTTKAHKTCMEMFDDEWLRGWMVWLCIHPLVEDPEASSNDRFVALELLKNACVAWTYGEPVGYWMADMHALVIES